MKERLGQTRLREEVARVNRRIQENLDRAAANEVADDARETHFWTEFVKPLLDARVEYFRDNALFIPKENLEKEQYAARCFAELRDHIESSFGTRDELLKEAEKLQRMLESMGEGNAPDPGEG